MNSPVTVSQSDLGIFLHELIANMAGRLEGGYEEAALIVDESVQDNALGDACHDFITEWIVGVMEGSQ